MGPLQTQTKTQARQPRPKPGLAVGAGALYGFVLRLLLPVFGLRLLTAESLEVEMERETWTVFLNDNVTIPCKVLGSSPLDIDIMAVTWSRKNLVNGTITKVFQFSRNHQESFRPGASVSLQLLAKGDASLQLPEVQLSDAGEYRCEVVNTPYKAQGTVILVVIACPVGSLSVQKAKGKDNDDHRLMCKATGFYPESIDITWYKWSQEKSQWLNISENVTPNAAISNEDNTFTVTSSLRPEHNATYRCMIKHTAFCRPWMGNITLPENGSESKSDSRNLLWIVAPCLAVVLLIFGAVFLWTRLLRFRNCCRKWTPNKEFIPVALDSPVV